MLESKILEGCTQDVDLAKRVVEIILAKLDLDLHEKIHDVNRKVSVDVQQRS